MDFTQQLAEHCLYFALDLRFGSADLCECLLPENTNIKQRSASESDQMKFNRVSFII